jgi:hypothetical protein
LYVAPIRAAARWLTNPREGDRLVRPVSSPAAGWWRDAELAADLSRESEVDLHEGVARARGASPGNRQVKLLAVSMVVVAGRLGREHEP